MFDTQRRIAPGVDAVAMALKLEDVIRPFRAFHHCSLFDCPRELRNMLSSNSIS